MQGAPRCYTMYDTLNNPNVTMRRLRILRCHGPSAAQSSQVSATPSLRSKAAGDIQALPHD